jgi:hypothetical protein
MAELKFNFKQIAQLNEDFKSSKKALGFIIRKTLSDQMRQIRRELAPLIPRKTGGIARTFGFTVRKTGDVTRARLGFIRRTSARTAIAANVMQHGSNVLSRSKAFLWIPLPGNSQMTGAPAITPAAIFANRDLLFVGKSKAGNLLAFRKEADGSVTPLFALKKEIHVRARPIPFENAVTSSAPQIAESIQNTIAQVIEARRTVVRELTGRGE